MHLDVVVTDASGKPVSGLGLKDFKLIDNKQARPILSLRASDDATPATLRKGDAQPQLILLLDTVNLPLNQVAFVREQTEKFLLENGGRLALPTSIYLFTEGGLHVAPGFSRDGNALAAIVNQIQPSIRTIKSSQGADADLQRFQLSLREMMTIADNNAAKPGRKLLVWIGPGWPMLESNNFAFSSADQARYFSAITGLSARLREARIALYSVSGVTTGNGALQYKAYLKGVTSASRADTGNLALKVLAVQSGGRAIDPDNDLAGQIAKCVADAAPFYTITFDPPKAEHVDEYHDLKIQIDRPNLTARTNTGYYDEPYK